MYISISQGATAQHGRPCEAPLPKIYYWTLLTRHSEKGSIEIGMTNIVLTGDLGCYYDYIVGIP